MEEQVTKSIDRILRSYGMSQVSYGYTLGFISGIISAREGSEIYTIHQEKSEMLDRIDYALEQAAKELEENGIAHWSKGVQL